MTIKVYGLHFDYLYKLNISTDVDFYVDTKEYHQNTNKKIYIQHEPSDISRLTDYLKDNAHLYDLIFCYDPLSIQKPNVYKRTNGHVWIDSVFYNSIDISKKKFAISNLTGWKTGCLGYYLRHLLYQNQQAFQQFPITFYRSSAYIIIPEITINPLIPKEPFSSKSILFENYQYHIVIENSREKNFFSEKIIDCLITKTLPIYYGCDNIGEYFDTTGWIILADEQNFLQDLYNQLHKLNESYYMNHLEIIEKNYQKAIEYCNAETNMTKLLHSHLP
jgi:hypothetical protein